MREGSCRFKEAYFKNVLILRVQAVGIWRAFLESENHETFEGGEVMKSYVSEEEQSSESGGTEMLSATRKMLLAVKTLTALTMAALLMSAASACSPVFEATRPNPVDLDQFTVGQSREQVVGQLGAPVSNVKEAGDLATSTSSTLAVPGR
jgi:hypothetical protein